MNKFKKFSLILLSSILLLCSSFIFTACGRDDDICKLYVFSTKGGYVQVDNHEEVVEFGDEGSRVFTYNENSSVILKAIANTGYRFVKWQFTDDLDEEYSTISNQPEIDLRLDDDEVVIKAVFELDGSISYNVTYPTSTIGYTIALENGYSNIVVLGGDLKFKVNLWQDYSNSIIVVKVNNEVCIPNSSGVYTVSNINTNIVISVTGVELNEQETPVDPVVYGIFTQDSRFTIIPVGQSTCEVEEGNSFTFTISPAPGYELGDNVVVKASGDVLIGNNGQYTINSVTKNINIVVEGIEEMKYTISTQDVSYIISPVNSVDCMVKQGENFTFTIVLVEGYKFGDNVVVKADGLILAANNGQYTIISVNKDMEITVEGIEELGEYNIYTNDDTFTIIPVSQNTCKVEEGASFTFKIQLKDGFKFSDNVIVRADGIDLVENQGQYTIHTVTTDMEITVEGIEKEVVSTYTISTKDTTYTIYPVGQSTCEVEEGENFTFKIILIAGYKFSDNVIVKANNEILTISNGQYTVNNVTTNVEIVVEGIEEDVIETYTISTKDTRYTITPVGQSTCEVQEGENFTFTITLANGYKFGNNVVVKANNQTLTVSNNQYTITNINNNIEITVTGIELITKIIYTQDTIYTIKPLSSTSCEVNDGASFTFAIEPASGYKFSDNVVVKANGITLTENNGQYTINSVTTDMEITVEGIEEIVTYTFTLSFEDGINQLNPDLALVIPENISFSIIESEKEDNYSTSQFIVVDNKNEKMSIKDLVDIINEEYAISKVTKLTINDKAFITINGDNMEVDWSLLQNVSSNYNLIIKFN